MDWEEALLFPVPGPAGLALRGTVWADRQPVADFHAALADIVTAGLPDRARGTAGAALARSVWSARWRRLGGGGVAAVPRQ